MMIFRKKKLRIGTIKEQAHDPNERVCKALIRNSHTNAFCF